jgi:hypothetical protein
MTTPSLTIADYPPVRGRLRIAGDSLRIESSYYPNAWRRFWYWALLGWCWERVDP